MEKGVKIGGIVVFIFFILAINIPNAAATNVSCGGGISSSTSLDSDLSCATSGLAITADNVKLKCNNHFIRGSFSTLSYGIRAINRKNITIDSCKILNFNRGIQFISTNQSILRYNNISNNNFGIFLGSSKSNNISNNYIENNNAIGIDLRLSSNDNLIFNNLFKNPLNARDFGRNFWDLNRKGLLGSWYFFEGVGNIIDDGSGNKQTGFLINEPSWITGIRGDALQFDGIDDYVALDMFLSGFLSQLSVTAWIKTDVGGESILGNAAILDFDKDSYFSLYIRGDDGRVGFSTIDNVGIPHNLYGTKPVNDGKWHFIVAVYNGFDKIIYIDGVEDSRAIFPHRGRALGLGGKRYGFIGDSSKATTFNGNRNNLYYKGLIDDVKIFDRALSTRDINNDFKVFFGRNIANGLIFGGNFWSDYTGLDIDNDGRGDTNLPYNSKGSISIGGDFVPLIKFIPITFIPDTRISANSAESKYPQIATDSKNNVHIVWEDKRNNAVPELYYTKLSNDGSKLTSEKRLTSNTFDDINPSIALDSNDDIHIVSDTGDSFRNANVNYRKFNNNGDTIIGQALGLDGVFPSIATDSENNAHVVSARLIGFNTKNIEYNKLTIKNNDVSVSPSPVTIGAAPLDEFVVKPSIAVDSNDQVHIAWTDVRDGHNEIYYAKLFNYFGKILISAKRLTFSTYAVTPSIAIDSENNVHMVWVQQVSGSLPVFYKKLDNNGNTIIPDTRLGVSGSSWRPSIAIDSNDGIHILWHSSGDALDYLKLDKDFYENLPLNNETIRIPTIHAADGFDSIVPVITVDSNNYAHLVWQDNRNGNKEIYYTREIHPKECSQYRNADPTDSCVITVNTTFRAGGLNFNLPNGIKILEDNINLDCNGATLQGNGSGIAGITIAGKSNVRVKNCIIKGYQNGIRSIYSKDTIIEKSKISNTQKAILFEHSPKSKLIENQIASSNIGININFSLDNEISNNNISNNNIGINLKDSSGNFIDSNYIVDNLINLKNNQKDSVTAIKNYWGFTLEENITQTITDLLDNSSLGFVAYNPWLCGKNEGISPCDTDLDEIPDDIDNCLFIPNRNQSNSDTDKLGDACDNNPDDDGILAGDNCPLVFNPFQEDADSDGRGDICDNCRSANNPTQVDADGDKLGDACDPFPFDKDNDIDGDGIPEFNASIPLLPTTFAGIADNCPDIANPGQADGDNDRLGDACDIRPARFDSDGDGFSDGEEVFIFKTNHLLFSTDADDYSDYCEIIGGPPADADGRPLYDCSELRDMSILVPPGNNVFVGGFPEVKINVSNDVSVETISTITVGGRIVNPITVNYDLDNKSVSITKAGLGLGEIINKWQEVATPGTISDILEGRTEKLTSQEELYATLYILGRQEQVEAVRTDTGIFGRLEDAFKIVSDFAPTAEKDVKDLKDAWKTLSDAEDSASGSKKGTAEGDTVITNSEGTFLIIVAEPVDAGISSTQKFAFNQVNSSEANQANQVEPAAVIPAILAAVKIAKTAYDVYSVGKSIYTALTSKGEQVNPRNVHQIASQEEWSIEREFKEDEVAKIRFSFTIKNIGTDKAREINDLRFDVQVGDNPPRTYPSPPNPGFPPITNLDPGSQVTLNVGEDLKINLRELRDIDLGKPIIITVNSFSLGVDDAAFDAVYGKDVLIEIDDSPLGDKKLRRYLTYYVNGETYMDVLKRLNTTVYTDVARNIKNRPINLKLQNGSFSSINNLEIDRRSWWTASMQTLSNLDKFEDELIANKSRLLLAYQRDSDLDSYTDREEFRLGTDPYDDSSHPETSIDVKARGTVGLYHFDSNTSDYSGNKNHGMTTRICNSVGRFGNACSIAGGFIPISSEKIDLTTGMTLEGWINPSTLSQDNTIFQQSVIRAINFSYHPSPSLAQLRLSYLNESMHKTELVSSASFNINEWHHVAAVIDPENRVMEIYLDGVKTAEKNITGNIKNVNFPYQFGSLYGLIDEFKIYDRARTSEEIFNDYIKEFNTNQAIDTAKIWLKLSNNGNDNAYGIEARLYSPDNTTKIFDGLIGGAGFLESGKSIFLSDSFEFNGSSTMSKPITLISYNDNAGNHIFQLNQQQSLQQSRFVVSQPHILDYNKANPILVSYFNPTNRIINATLLIGFSNLTGISFYHNESRKILLKPGSNNLLLSWNPSEKLPQNFLPSGDIIKTFAVLLDQQRIIIDLTVEKSVISGTVNTITGTNIDVNLPLCDAKATFNEVTENGDTLCAIVPSGPSSPADLQIIPQDSPIYYNVDTSATFINNVEICFVYDENHVTGDEADLILNQYDSITATWNDITSLPVDTVNNIICGSTNHFSFLTIMMPSIIGFNIPLTTGFNLISLPLSQIDGSLPGVLNSINTSYDVIYYYNSSNVGNEWVSFNVNKPSFLNTLTKLDETQGFWINALQNTTLIVRGRPPLAPEFKLKQGFNLIGYPSILQNPASIVFSNVSSFINYVFAYNATTKQFDVYIPGNLGTLTMIKQGLGYWVDAKQDANWTFDGVRYVTTSKLIQNPSLQFANLSSLSNITTSTTTSIIINTTTTEIPISTIQLNQSANSTTTSTTTTSTESSIELNISRTTTSILNNQNISQANASR